MHQFLVSLLGSLFILSPPSSCLIQTSISSKIFANLKGNQSINLTQKNIFVKRKNILVIKPINACSITFKDVNNNEDETSQKTYIYLGYIASIKNYLIQVQKYESSEYMLISANGSKTLVDDIPYISNTGNFIVTISKGLEYPGNYNGIRLYKAVNGIINKVCDLKLNSYEPLLLKWYDNTTFLIKSQYVDSNNGQADKFSYTRYMIK